MRSINYSKMNSVFQLLPQLIISRTFHNIYGHSIFSLKYISVPLDMCQFLIQQTSFRLVQQELNQQCSDIYHKLCRDKATVVTHKWKIQDLSVFFEEWHQPRSSCSSSRPRSYSCQVHELISSLTIQFVWLSALCFSSHPLSDQPGWAVSLFR